MSDAPKRYEINSIADMAAVPRERWDAFLVDLTIVVNCIRSVHDHFDMGPECMTPEGGMIWIDDDAPGVTLILHAPDNSVLCTVTAGEDA